MQWLNKYKNIMSSGNEDFALEYEEKINSEIYKNQLNFSYELKCYLVHILNINRDINLFLKQHINDPNYTFIYKIEFWFNFCKYAENTFNSYSRSYVYSQKELYSLWYQIKEDINSYCDYKLIDIINSNNEFILIPKNESILIQTIQNDNDTRLELFHLVNKFYKTNETSEKETIMFEINKPIFEYIGKKYIDKEMNLFNPKIMEEYRNYVNCFRHDLKDTSINKVNKEWREKNWNNILLEEKNEKMKEFLIISLEIYVWLDFKKIINK